MNSYSVSSEQYRKQPQPTVPRTGRPKSGRAANDLTFQQHEPKVPAVEDDEGRRELDNSKISPIPDQSFSLNDPGPVSFPMGKTHDLHYLEHSTRDPKTLP